MNPGRISITPAGQTPDGLTLAVQDLQSRVSFYQWTTALLAATALGMYLYPKYKPAAQAKYASAREAVREHRRAAGETLRSTRESVAARIAPLGGPQHRWV